MEAYNEPDIAYQYGYERDPRDPQKTDEPNQGLVKCAASDDWLLRAERAAPEVCEVTQVIRQRRFE